VFLKYYVYIHQIYWNIHEYTFVLCRNHYILMNFSDNLHITFKSGCPVKSIQGFSKIGNQMFGVFTIITTSWSLD